MSVDPSWGATPVVNPDLPARKRRRIFEHADLTDPIGIEEPAYQLEDRGVLVVPSALDRPSRERLLRAQQAIAAALDADDCGAVEPGDAVPERTLRWHEWEIALALRDITDLSEEHALNAASAGPMTQAVLKGQRDALAQAVQAIEARVAELERYAACVRAAEIAYRDWLDAQRVADLNDRYLDLVARTAADEHAVAEISQQTDRAAAAQTFQQAAREVGLAAEALALP